MQLSRYLADYEAYIGNIRKRYEPKRTKSRAFRSGRISTATPCGACSVTGAGDYITPTSTLFVRRTQLLWRHFLQQSDRVSRHQPAMGGDTLWGHACQAKDTTDRPINPPLTRKKVTNKHETKTPCCADTTAQQLISTW